ncbi:TIGR00730 family Rossman fold protein [Stenomitos frigidus]|uniref:Cytokinin riboside 5'-monophosphate phosphoribohydrolase n=1 Tax=Stenomitos frigidus ULC18 TaxID=2107698 RepID=A0A2T1E2E0_9CYAN|nr:TIGR00730 family Rossman fold protein [Stenomitos frigidus]PSB26897.1 TIGR00730 family Rossman fold protein [Stenomitos frigidus ULC18]
MKHICVFCGSNQGAKLSYKAAAQALGQALVKRGLGLVYGGGNVGLMGTIADSVLAVGGTAIGVIPQALVDKELAHKSLTQLHIVSSMHERKALMADLSDGFIALPGGFGTFEEFCEVLTWAQLGFHQKPCGLLNIDEYYSPLIAMFDHATAEQFVLPPHRSLVLEAQDPDQLLDKLASYEPITVQKWIDRKEL